ncbi:Glycerol kinase [Tulasnella sp. JGI-2019a]|nr:Glycerol kinase [Tulasnella sp. JGI-2019a]KAG9001981.1 Glycerol kinase [Tulasnella sp. JGI-2019a]KAG9030272.1 Glycerol kinase [Tulasnella sp. JGI-2019a]
MGNSTSVQEPVELEEGEFVGALDCGTTSTRFIVFDKDANIVVQYQAEFPQYYPHPGWHEHHPQELCDVTVECLEGTAQKLKEKGYTTSSIRVIGITNQRETTVAWSKSTGKHLCNAIVWDDGRTASVVQHYNNILDATGIELPDGTFLKGAEGKKWISERTGLPISTYFSAIKLHWMIMHHPEVQEALDKDDLAFGTVDSWLIYNMTKTADKPGLHLTDPTNASRSLLLDLHSLEWSDTMLKFFGLKRSILPELKSSAEVYGTISEGAMKGIRIAGIAGDQQAALIGNKCLTKGEGKNTYGTGAFVLFNTGEDIVVSKRGLIGTVAYQAGPHVKPTYALEGSISVAGSAIKWLRDGINIIDDTHHFNVLAAQCEDTGGLYFVTALSGLLAPYWDPGAAGLMIGLTSYTTPAHIARATLEAAAFHTLAVVDAMKADANTELKRLKVDGGMTNSDLMMQIQADLGGFDVVRPEMRESTALGAALLAASAVGLFGWDLTNRETVEHVNSKGKRTFKPTTTVEERNKRMKDWTKAVERSRNWNVYGDDD